MTDTERIDWLQRQIAKGVHVEAGFLGSFSGCDLKAFATVYVGAGETRADTIREAIDRAAGYSTSTTTPEGEDARIFMEP
jgi:hypothetical protein